MKFIITLTLFLFLFSDRSSGDEGALPDQLTDEILREISLTATEDGTLSAELEGSHIFKKPTEAHCLLEVNDETTFEKYQIQSKVAGNGYLILTRSNEEGKLLQTDVIRYHETTKLFHRWQFFEDDKIPTRIFIGDPHQPEVSDEKNWRNLFWRCIAPGGTTITIKDRFSGGPDPGTSLRSHLIEFENHRVIRREQWIVQTKPSDPQKTKKPTFLSKIFGKRDPNSVDDGQKKYTFEDLNFTYTVPIAEAKILDPEKFNPAANVLLIDQATDTGFTIIVEALGEDFLTMEQLKLLAVENLSTFISGAKAGEPREVLIDQAPFTLLPISGKRGNSTYYYTCLLSTYNGYLCQLNGYQVDTNARKSAFQTLALAAGFHFIDRNRKAQGEGSVTPYRNDALGISFDPVKVGGREWDLTSLWEEYPAASYGITYQQTSTFLIIPIDLAGLEPTDTALASGFFNQTGIHFKNEITQSVPHTQGSASGFHYECQRQSNGTTYDIRARVLRNGNTACLLLCQGYSLTGETKEHLTKILDAVQFSQPKDFNLREIESPNRQRDPQTINQIGLHYYMEGKYREAIPFFERAKQIKPDSPDYVGNIVLSYHHDGRSSEALKFWNDHKDSFADDLTYRSFEPMMLTALGQQANAADKYAELFEIGYRDEEDLLTYLNLLSDLDRYDEAIAAIDRFLENGGSDSIRPRRWQHQIYSQGGRPAEALTLARKLADEFPQNQLLKNDLVYALIDQEEGKEALELLTGLLEESPTNSELLYQRGRAFQVEKEYQKSKESYESALEQEPDSEVISEAISVVSALLGQGDQSAIRTPIDPIMTPKALEDALALAPPIESSEGFNAKVVRNVMGYYFRKGDRFKSTKTLAVKIFNQGGVEDYKTIRFDFDPTYERAFINKIEVIDAEGAVITKSEDIESFVSDTSAQDGEMATTSSTVTATVPGLKPGCLLKYQYTVQNLNSRDDFPFQIHFLASSSPSGPRAFFVSGEIDTISVHTENSQFQTTTGPDHQSWHLMEPPRYYRENLSPKYEEFLPWIAIGPSQTDWIKLGDDYLLEMEDRLKADTTVEALAEELTQNLTSDEAKASAIVRHVQDKLVYQAIEFGTRGRMPAKASRILQNRYGDCKDHSLLIYQLLRAVQVPAHLTLIHSSLPTVPETPSLDQFDHMIVYAPTIRGGTFFDATAKHTATHPTAPLDFAGLQALVLESGKTRLITVPEDPTYEHRIDSNRQVTVSADFETLKIQESVTLHGSYAEGIRGWLLRANKAERKRNLEQLLGERVRLTIDDLKFTNLADPEKPLKVTMTYGVADSISKRGQKLESLIPSVWEDFYLEVSQSGERHTPFSLTVPLVTSSEVSVIYPESATLQSPIWHAGSTNGPGFTNELMVLPNGSIKNTLTLFPGTYPKDQFANYSKGLSKTLQGIQGKLQLELTE